MIKHTSRSAEWLLQFPQLFHICLRLMRCLVPLAASPQGHCTWKMSNSTLEMSHSTMEDAGLVAHQCQCDTSLWEAAVASTAQSMSMSCVAYREWWQPASAQSADLPSWPLCLSPPWTSTSMGLSEPCACASYHVNAQCRISQPLGVALILVSANA